MSQTANTHGILKTWTQVKNMVDTHSLLLHYVEDPKKYVVFVDNWNIRYKAEIFKDGFEAAGIDPVQNASDRDDFINNYQPSANGKMQLSVKAELESNQQVNVEYTGLTKKLRYDSMTADQSIATGSYTSIYSYSGSGKFFGFELQFSNHDMQLQLLVDGETVINGINVQDISMHASLPDMLLLRPENKEVKMIVTEGIKYDSSIEIKAKSGVANKKLSLGYVILSKES